jgi:hypothetical protein
MTCSQCKHWGGEEVEKDGVCRGVPPTPIAIATGREIIMGGAKIEYKINSYFPVTRGTTPACGTFKMKEAES